MQQPEPEPGSAAAATTKPKRRRKPRGESALARLLAMGYVPPAERAGAVAAAPATIADAKRALAPSRELHEWSAARLPPAARVELDAETLVIVSPEDGSRARLADNVRRVPVASFQSEHGDDLPHEPAVLTGCCEGWSAMTWTVEELARCLPAARAVTLDGGPAFARMSLGRASVPMREYLRYCTDSAEGDVAPLYVFDADVLALDELRAGW